MPTKGTFRHILILVTICGAAVCPLRAQQKPDDVVRVNTDLVQTDFMVFDKQGNFVDSLKREQLVLKVEGKPREISFFDRISAGSRNEEAQLAAARGTNVTGGPAPVPLDRGRTVLFFIDDLHLSAGSVTYTRQMLKRFIDHDLKQNDQAEIASASGQLGFLQQLTDNKSVLTSAADRLRALSPTPQTGEYPPMTEYQAMAIERNDDELLNFFIDELIKREGNLPRPQAAEMIKARAAQLVVEGASVVTRSFSTLRGFINLAAAIPGRKIVFFVSDGFLTDQPRSDNYDRLQRITQAAAKSGVVIYALNARGLGAGLPDASQVVMADPSGVLLRTNGGELRATQDGMNALASDTGGRAFFNTNSMPSAIATALKETSTYYLLAWRPETDEQRNPKFRRIEVSVVDHPDLVVRFRRGFGEPADEAAKNKEKQGEALPLRKTPSEEINAVLQAQYPTTAMPVAIALNYLDTAQYGGTLTTTIKVKTGSLALEKQQDGSAASLDVAGLVLNDQGKSVHSFSKRFTIRASVTNQNNRPPENIFYNDFALVNAGLYQVRVAVVDVKSGTRGSAYQWIEVPNVANKELTLSSLVVGERKFENEAQPLEAASNDPHQPEPMKQVMINVDRRFAGSSYLRFLTFVYNAASGSGNLNSGQEGNTVPLITLPGKEGTAPDKGGVTPPGKDRLVPANTTTATAAPDLAVQVQVFRDNEPVITTPLHKIPAEAAFDAQRVPYAADVSLSGLQPGSYVLQVTVIDRLAKASATRKFNFYVE